MRDLLCGIDVGTNGVKAMLFDAAGGVKGEGRAEYPTAHPAPGWAEQLPEDWWTALCRATRRMIESSGAEPGRVGGIAVSAQAPTLIALDGDGEPVRPALIWMDRRADREAERVGRSLEAAGLHALTGNRPDSFYVAAKILWLKEREPDRFRRTRRFLQINGYLGYRLSGRFSLDTVHAGLLQLRAWPGGSWIPELMALCGVESGQFPDVSAPHEIVGEVSERASVDCGLEVGTPVLAGTVDGAAAAIEAGAVLPGAAAEMTGTSTVLLMPNAGAATEPSFIAMPHAVPGAYLLLGAMSSTGASLRWFRDELGAEAVASARARGIDPYEALAEEAAASPPGSNGVLFLPYMMGERSPLWNSNARGLFFGMTLGTKRSDLVRSILEGTAYALRHNVEVARTAGVTLSELRSVGGGSRSPLWCQIKADVLGVPVHVPSSAGGAPFGDAVLVSMALGRCPDVPGYLARAVRIARSHLPNPAHRALYDERYRLFRELYEAVRGVFDRSAEAERDGRRQT